MSVSVSVLNSEAASASFKMKSIKYHSTSFTTYLRTSSDGEFDKNEPIQLNLEDGADLEGYDTIGRPAWYDFMGRMKEAFVIGFGGPSGSGKTTVSKKLIAALNTQFVTVLSMDSFYKDPTQEQRELIEQGVYNFDHIDALDFDLCYETLRKLKLGRPVDVPEYDFKTHSRVASKRMYGARIIVFEGILVFHDPRISNLIDLKVFVNVDRETCLSRRLRRDTRQRNRTVESIIAQYEKYVKPASEQFVLPSMHKADVILPNGTFSGSHLRAGMIMLTAKVRKEIMERGFKVRSVLRSLADSQDFAESGIKRARLHTLMVDSASLDDSGCLLRMRLLYEKSKTIGRRPRPPAKHDDSDQYESDGDESPGTCGVSISRRATLEHLFAPKVIDFDYLAEGLLDIRTNKRTDEPELHYVRLPDMVHKMRVLLADTHITTGAGTMMAIRTLLDHGVNEHRITLLALTISRSGYDIIGRVFPEITIITCKLVESTLSRKLN